MSSVELSFSERWDRSVEAAQKRVSKWPKWKQELMVIDKKDDEFKEEENAKIKV